MIPMSPFNSAVWTLQKQDMAWSIRVNYYKHSQTLDLMADVISLLEQVNMALDIW